MNSKAILLATAVFSIALSASALADSYYFRSKGSPVSDVSGNPDNGGEDTSPETPASASFGFVADKYRAGTTISGTLDSTLTTPSWSFTQTPAEPSIGFATVEGGVTATAPTVEDPITFQVTATASEGVKTVTAGSASVTVHPILAITGGPAGEIKGTVNTALDAQPAYVLKGLVDTATYTLMQSSAPMTDFGTQCPGLSFSATDGKISGTPTDVCSLENLTVKVKDDFDETEATSGVFSLKNTLPPSNVMAWGYNSSGQLGDGTKIDRSTSAPVLGGKTYKQVAAGIYHACGLAIDGTVDCWGFNGYGQLGIGTTENKLLPVKVQGLSGVTSIAAGSYHTCAIVSGGAKCWGYNGNGQLGDGSTTNRTSPVQVSGLTSGVTKIATGDSHTCAIVSGGAVKCWGSNSGGQLGDGSTTNRTAPVQVSGLPGGVPSITAGTYHTCAIVSGGAKCWGSNNSGQLGNTAVTWTTSPVSAGLTSGVTAIAAGDNHTCAIVSGGAKCWGSNNSGQLGDTTTTNRSTPVQVVGLTSGVSGIASGANSTYAW